MTHTMIELPASEIQQGDIIEPRDTLLRVDEVEEFDFGKKRMLRFRTGAGPLSYMPTDRVRTVL